MFDVIKHTQAVVDQYTTASEKIKKAVNNSDIITATSVTLTDVIKSLTASD